MNPYTIVGVKCDRCHGTLTVDVPLRELQIGKPVGEEPETFIRALQQEDINEAVSKAGWEVDGYRHTCLSCLQR